VSPGQTELVPLIAPAAPGSGFTVKENAAETEPVLQLFDGVTVIFPEVPLADILTVILFVPDPAVILAPEGRTQLYVVAFVTAGILNTSPVWP
jgi:hypothetical protein